MLANTAVRHAPACRQDHSIHDFSAMTRPLKESNIAAVTPCGGKHGQSHASAPQRLPRPVQTALSRNGRASGWSKRGVQATTATYMPTCTKPTHALPPKRAPPRRHAR